MLAKFINTTDNIRPWWHNRYSDSLKAGRSGVRTPVRASFSGPLSTGPEAHPAFCTMGNGSFPRGQCGRGMEMATHSHLTRRLWTSRAITLRASVPSWRLTEWPLRLFTGNIIQARISLRTRGLPAGKYNLVTTFDVPRSVDDTDPLFCWLSSSPHWRWGQHLSYLPLDMTYFPRRRVS